MQLSHDAAKQVAGLVFFLAFAALFPAVFSLKAVAGPAIVLPAVFFTTFVVAPAIALAVYLRLGGDMETLLEALGRPDAIQRSEDTETTPTTTEVDSLTTLRERYARGELTDAEFERKVDRLLQTDSPEHAAEWRERTREPATE